MKIGKVLFITLLIGILKVIWAWLTCGWLFNWVYRLEPTIIWKKPEQIPFGFAMLMDFVFAFFLVLIYTLIRKGLPGKGIVKGFWFGLFVWLIGELPGSICSGIYTIMSQTVVIYWVINFFILSILEGTIIAATYGKESD